MTKTINVCFQSVVTFMSIVCVCVYVSFTWLSYRVVFCFTSLCFFFRLFVCHFSLVDLLYKLVSTFNILIIFFLCCWFELKIHSQKRYYRILFLFKFLILFLLSNYYWVWVDEFLFFTKKNPCFRWVIEYKKRQRYRLLLLLLLWKKRDIDWHSNQTNQPTT